MHNFELVNLDTDSITVCKKDGSLFSEQERKNLLKELNSLMPEKISWDDDGYYERIVVTKAKNYILWDGKKLKIKGASLKATQKEHTLKQFIDEVINCLVFDKQNELVDIYHKYVKEIHNITDITRFTSKKTLTEAVMNPERTTEQKINDAIVGEELQMGDKFRVYFTNDGSLKLEQHWSGDHCTNTLLSKLWNTIKIFENVIDIAQFPKYHLKSHKIKVELHRILGLPEPIKEKRTRKKKDEQESNQVCTP